jgi:hypothetical protein
MQRPSKSLKKAPSKKPKKKQLLVERLLRGKRSIKKKQKRKLNTHILKILVPVLPKGRMNFIYNEAKKTVMI